MTGHIRLSGLNMRGWNGGIAVCYNWHDAIHENSPLSNPNTQNPCGLNIKFPYDDNSHGTHTMGTMVWGSGRYTYQVWHPARNGSL
ncbi:MAG: hypothetical protein IPN87_14560 [Saprospiraceae bacterium]|nr:hypothetical protein [Candidatus Brachybacter algidus]